MSERPELAAWPPYQARIQGWRQVSDRRVPDAAAATQLIEEAGIATVYPASSEVANLFHAHMGDPEAKTDSKWDSPSGTVYTWRWTIGTAGSAFYATVVRKRPTFVTWPLVPAILRLTADLRTPDELFDFGVISADAYRIAQVLEGSEEPIGTGDIRKQGGFPTGKDHSNRYHKGLAELENRLLVTSEFLPSEGVGEGIKHHGLMYVRRRADVEAALMMSQEAAVDALLQAYLPAAAYVEPRALAKHLRVPEADMEAGVERLEASGRVHRIAVPGAKATAFSVQQ